MEIKLDGEYSEKEEKREGRPGTYPDSVGYEKKSPKPQQDNEENPSLRDEREIKMAEIDASGIGDEDRNERKAKNSTHLGIKETTLSAAF